MEAKYNTEDKKQVVFFQVNKDKTSDLVRKYGVRGFPSFVYVKPGTRANVATKF
jgi:thioredoxin-related protein